MGGIKIKENKGRKIIRINCNRKQGDISKKKKQNIKKRVNKHEQNKGGKKERIGNITETM